MTRPVINCGVLLALSPEADDARVRRFAEAATEDARAELEDATRAEWHFHVVEPVHLDTSEPRLPSDFLDEASLAMVEGPYDIVLVVTDLALTARRKAIVSGLASETANVAILSARKLLVTPRGKAVRKLEDEDVRWNAAALVLHLMGHVMHLRHTHGGPDDAMAPWRFDETRREVPRFSQRHRAKLPRRARGVPEDEADNANVAASIWFHLRHAVRHVDLVLPPLLRSRAPFLTLALPGLVTAAIVPTLILIFTAEIWDVGLTMEPHVSWSFAVGAILASTWYLTVVQNLFYPRKERRTLTAHMAVVNVTILLTMLLAVIGLFAMVAALMLFVSFYIFPPGLIQTWPTLGDPEVTTYDKVRLATFVSTVALLTGALAGGFEKRAVIRQLALFEDDV